MKEVSKQQSETARGSAVLSSSTQLQEISNRFEGKHPLEVLHWVNHTFQPSEVAMATGFGAEGVVLIDMIVSVNREIPIFYLDTEVLFPETYQLRDRLEGRYGIRFVRYASALTVERQAELYGNNLWERNPDLCCTIRKVEPLREALQGRSAWITAVRRDQSPFRANAGIVEHDKKFGLIKVNPLAGWTKKEVWKYIMENNLPYNPLYDQGYTSIGCTHCTTPVMTGEDERAGRWRGFQKTECGLHYTDTSAQQERRTQ